MEQNSQQEALTVTTDEPNVEALKTAYNKTIDDLDWYLSGSRENYRWRRNIWEGKSRSLRKKGGDAFPWEGAADTEAHVISQRINTYIALFMTALQRANIRAQPNEVNDVRKARGVSSFLKWMVSSYIPDFKRQMELGANNLLEKGIILTYCGWEKAQRPYKQSLSIEEIAQVSPDLARMVLERSDDSALVELLKQQYPGVNDKRAKKILKQLREKGIAEFVFVRKTVDRPCVEALSPDCDFFFPAYTTDPQSAPYCFRRVLMTAQELRSKVTNEGWDEDWVEYVIKNCHGVTDVQVNEERIVTLTDTITAANEDLYEILYAYQRLTDMEDGSEGIYCTVFHADAVGKTGMTQNYAKHELLNGYDDYPVIVTKLSEDDKRLYEVLTVPELLRSPQMIIKIERDSRIDRNSLATVPPIMHPSGSPAPNWGPGIKIPYRRSPDEIQFGDAPQFNPGSVEMENTQLMEADGIMGLRLENPLDGQRQQYLVTKFLEHVRDVIKLAFKCYQRFGPDQVGFRVTGSPEFVQFVKGDPNDEYDVTINYDVLNNDPETVEQRLNAFASLLQFDRNGRIDVDLFLDAAASSIDPIMADSFLRPAQEAQGQIVKDVTDDLSKIYAGIEVGARPNGAQIALQVIQQYLQQPDVMQRAQSDEAFQARLQKYAEQYTFQLEQARNATIGRLGTSPAQMGSVNTQNVQ